MYLREESYIILEGILYHIQAGAGKHNASAQLVVPQNLKETLLKLHHEHPYGAHSGTKRMLSIFLEKYYWLGITQDVDTFVKSCQKCSQAKPTSKKITPELQLREPVPAPFHTMIIDTVGPFKATKRGNVQLVVVTDQCTRYVEAWPARNITAETMAKQFHENVVCRHGAPKRLLSDNGSAFTSALFQNICKMYNIKNVYSPAYYPKAQGETERMNRTMLGQMRTMCEANQKNWDDIIKPLVFSINTTENRMRGQSAFMLVHGRLPVFPAEIQLPDVLEHNKPVQEHLADILENQRVAQEFARKRLQRDQKHMKAYYDKQSNDNPIKEGDTVYVYQPTVRIKKIKKKLINPYQGPYSVISYKSANTVYLRRLIDYKDLDKPVHVSRLKKGKLRAEVNRWDPIPNLQGDPLSADDLNDPQVVTTNTDQTDADSDTDSVIVPVGPAGNTRSRRTMPDPPVINHDPINDPQPSTSTANIPTATHTKRKRGRPPKRKHKGQAK
jgi:transposase InsO family protein